MPVCLRADWQERRWAREMRAQLQAEPEPASADRQRHRQWVAGERLLEFRQAERLPWCGDCRARVGLPIPPLPFLRLAPKIAPKKSALKRSAKPQLQRGDEKADD